MPVHWYYNRTALIRDYGEVKDYMAPRNPHPDSILWRSSYTPPNKKAEILHEQARYWGKHGIHYHQFLRAGENTLNIKLCTLLIHSLNERGRYDADDYLRRYIEFMTTPHTHRDTYLEEFHRHFFERYALGYPPRKCGIKEKHIGGLVGIPPIVIFYKDDPTLARKAALEHLSLTHLGPTMEAAGSLLIDLILETLAGESLRNALIHRIEKGSPPFFSFPYKRWFQKPDAQVVGRHLSSACYVEDSVPSVIYLAFKYHKDPERALIVNTGLGGDNAHRGAILGALLGAGNGLESFPKRWIEGLQNPPPDPTSQV